MIRIPRYLISVTLALVVTLLAYLLAAILPLFADVGGIVNPMTRQIVLTFRAFRFGS